MLGTKIVVTTFSLPLFLLYRKNRLFSLYFSTFNGFSYTTRLGFLGQCIFAKQNAHVCVESSAFANAHLSYFIGIIDFLFDI